MNTYYNWVWIALIGIWMSSCASSEPAEISQKSRQVTAVPAVKTNVYAPPAAQVAYDTTGSTPSVDPLLLYDQVAEWRKIDQASTGHSEESILPLRQFKGTPISESVVLIMPLSPDTVKLYVDYFEGDLVGSKVFYASTEGLLAVDVYELADQQTEDGRHVESLLTHTFCYHKQHVIHHVQHHPRSAGNKATLAEENLADWVIIHEELQLL